MVAIWVMCLAIAICLLCILVEITKIRKVLFEIKNYLTKS